jgi:hypothetical protein
MTTDKQSEAVIVPATPGEHEALSAAKLRLGPMMRHATTANAMAAKSIAFTGAEVTALESTAALTIMADQVKGGDLGPVTDYLLAQAVMLDSTVTELMRRAWQNVGDYPEAFRSYMGLALKAQAQSRASLEALARVHQPREQVVKHVHVNEGGQAVVAEHLHIGSNGGHNAAIADQCHAATAAGASGRAALPSPDPIGRGVPISGSEGQEAVPHARRQQPRRAPRKSERGEARTSDG